MTLVHVTHTRITQSPDQACYLCMYLCNSSIVPAWRDRAGSKGSNIHRSSNEVTKCLTVVLPEKIKIAHDDSAIISEIRVVVWLMVSEAAVRSRRI